MRQSAQLLTENCVTPGYKRSFVRSKHIGQVVEQMTNAAFFRSGQSVTQLKTVGHESPTGKDTAGLLQQKTSSIFAIPSPSQVRTNIRDKYVQQEAVSEFTMRLSFFLFFCPSLLTKCDLQRYKFKAKKAHKWDFQLR